MNVLQSFSTHRVSMRPSDISELVRHRRTIKPITANGEPNYLDRDVEPAVLQQLLDNANWAPTHGLTEPWRFVVFQGESRFQLADFLATTYTELTPDVDFKAAKLEKLRLYAQRTTVAIAVGMKRHHGVIPAEEEVIAVACAVQNMQLTAAAHELGTFWSSSPIYDHPSTRQFLGWTGEDDRCLGIMYVGYPVNSWPERKHGQPDAIEEKVEWRS
jgi:nitroreductase